MQTVIFDGKAFTPGLTIVTYRLKGFIADLMVISCKVTVVSLRLMVISEGLSSVTCDV